MKINKKSIAIIVIVIIIIILVLTFLLFSKKQSNNEENAKSNGISENVIQDYLNIKENSVMYKQH